MARLRNKRLLFGIVAPGILVFVALLVASFNRPPNPRYKGTRLSEYAEAASPFTGFISGPRQSRILMQGAVNIRARHEAETAIRALGPAAVPFFESWLKSESTLRFRLRKLASAPRSRFSWLLRWRWLQFEPRAIALDLVGRLIPQHAASLLPLLRNEVFEDRPGFSDQSANLFARILESLPPEEGKRLAHANADLLDRLLANPTKPLDHSRVSLAAALLACNPPADREAMLRRLWPFRNNEFNSIRTLISRLDPDSFLQNLLYLELGTATEKPAAAQFFCDSPRSPERIVPLLGANLGPESSNNLLQNTCDALASFGTNSASALPLISNLLGHRKPYVARAASNAIRQITMQPILDQNGQDSMLVGDEALRPR